MTDAVAGGAAIAWRLLATLEGGSLLIAASALLAFAARGRTTKKHTRRRRVQKVLVTNPNSTLGKEIITRLELRGCEVSTLSSDAGETAISGGENEVDALIVVGAGLKVEGLDGMAGLVSEDVYCNLKLLESLAGRLQSGGRIVWACASSDDNNNGDGGGVYAAAVQAYDGVLQATLQHISRVARCEPIWIGRCDDPQESAERSVAALVNIDTPETQLTINLRHAAATMYGYITRWTKTTT